MNRSYFSAAKSFRGGYHYRFLPEKQEFIGFIRVVWLLKANFSSLFSFPGFPLPLLLLSQTLVTVWGRNVGLIFPLVE